MAETLASVMLRQEQACKCLRHANLWHTNFFLKIILIIEAGGGKKWMGLGNGQLGPPPSPRREPGVRRNKMRMPRASLSS